MVKDCKLALYDFFNHAVHKHKVKKLAEKHFSWGTVATIFITKITHFLNISYIQHEVCWPGENQVNTRVFVITLDFGGEY